MNSADLLIMACSPRSGGNSDFAAKCAFDMARKRGLSSEIIFLRDYKVLPCAGCHKCSLSSNFSCVLDHKDQCRSLLEKIDKSRMVCFCSPIYFYHVPANFKALIDRSQSYYERWMQQGAAKTTKKALVVLVAGRKKGQSLFQGTLLSLKYFLEPFNYEIHSIGLRGLDQSGDLESSNESSADLMDFFAQSINRF